MRKIKIYKYCLYTVVYTHTRRAYTFHSLEYRLYGGMSVDLFLHLVVTRFFLVCCYFVLNFVQLPPHACVRLPSVRARWFECCRSIPIKFFAVRSFVFFRFSFRSEKRTCANVDSIEQWTERSWAHVKRIINKENKWKRLRQIKIYINSYKEPCEECFSSTFLPLIHKDAIN